MKRFLPFAIAAIALTSTAAAHDFDAGAIYIDHPMVEEAPPSARVLGGYVSLHNQGAEDDRLIGIESTAAEKVELHRSVVTDGIARMQPLTDGIALPAGEMVWLGSDGTHAMFIGPDKRYVVGDELPAVLVFEKAGRVDVTFRVEERSTDRAPGHGEHAQ
jgi:copper(I)-binding protein